MANMMDKLQITGFGEETMRQIGATSFNQLMKMVDMEHPNIYSIGDLTSKSLISQLTKLKDSNILDWRLIGALGFSDSAANTWKSIFSSMTLEDLHHYMRLYDTAINRFNDCTGYNFIFEILKNARGIGAHTAKTIIEEYPFFYEDISYILDNIMYQNSKGVKLTKIRFTGVRDKDLVDYLNANGYDAGEGSVTKDTDILIIPTEGYNTGSKYNKAVQYGVTIKSIDQFKEEIGYGS
jgi:NAD-dependent DNA ligase